MTIKILCTCGTKYAFEVEPVDGKMPFRVECPQCHADGTNAADASLLSNLVQSAPAPVPSSPAAAAGVIRVQATPSQIEEAPPTVNYCPRHREEIVVAECAVCRKPICGRCLEQFGYLCSGYCRSQATARGLYVPVYEGHKEVVEEKRVQKLKRLALAGGILAVALLGGWVWYQFWGSVPRVVHTAALPQTTEGTTCRLISPTRLLTASASRVAVTDLSSGQDVWSTTLAGASLPVRSANTKLNQEAPGAQLYTRAHVFTSAKDVWLVLSDRVACFDLATGKRKDDVPFPSPFLQADGAGNELVIASGPNSLQPTLTKIGLSDGKALSEASRLTTVAPRPKTPPSAMDVLFEERPAAEFYASGQGAVVFQARLLEARSVARKAMRDKTGPSAFEQGNISGANSGQAVHDLMNDMTRESTGGVEMEDASRYQVSLSRYLPTGGEWRGEVIGSPNFHVSKTVNLVTASRTLLVFDKENNLRWQAALTYPVWDRLIESEEHVAPCREHGSTLFFFDQGTLTAFDLLKGEVRWRLTSVGISKVEPDAEGKLIVTSTTATPDTIQFSQEVNFKNRINPVILRVEPATGKVLWMREGIGETAYVSGKYLYTTSAQISAAEYIGAGGNLEEVPIHYRVRRIDPATGGEKWVWYRPRPAQTFQPLGNCFLVQSRAEAAVLSFFDF
jgi:hypothetical protein